LPNQQSPNNAQKRKFSARYLIVRKFVDLSHNFNCNLNISLMVGLSRSCSNALIDAIPAPPARFNQHFYKETTMKTAEGKIGRVFVLHFEAGDRVREEVRKFLADVGIMWGYVHFLGGQDQESDSLAGLISPDADGAPQLQWWHGAEMSAEGKAVIYEIAGLVWQPGAEETEVSAAIANRHIAPTVPIVTHVGDHTHILTVFNAEFA
jgi:hypothetical protein